MKVAILGEDGIVAARLADILRSLGHCPQNAAGMRQEAFDDALAGASAVVDLTQRLPHRHPISAAGAHHIDTPSADERRRLAHYVVLGEVGAGRLASSCFRAQRAHERLIASSSSAHTLVRMTPCFEAVEWFVQQASQNGVARVPATLMQPIGADDAAFALARIVLDPPQNRLVEIAGPEAIEFEELARELASAREIPLRIVADPQALYFGAPLERRSLLPGAGALLGADTFADWLRRSIPPG